jgi:sodium/potassium/calcium exchanger 6
VRAMVALSVAISPVWLIYYLWNMHGLNLLDDGGWFYFLVLWSLFVFGSALILRYAPGGEGDMSLHLATPIALYGFCIAATWIDTIADNLVNLLDFVGIILKIPAPIVGLTILAWGNSMGDLSANMTMARKGLANMAMTACFAGPLFNILVGLGLGFSSLAAQTGKVEAAVSLSPSVVTGFLFIIANTGTIVFTGLLLGQGTIPVKYGYIALTLYSIYLVTSIALQYSKYGDN